jgi:AbrB family looped-hinge helix DNA binding protein
LQDRYYVIRGRTTITRKGQVTLPVEIRRALGLKEGDQVTFVMTDDGLRVETGSIVERTRGMIKSRRPPLTVEQMRAEAEIAIAEEAERRSR